LRPAQVREPEPWEQVHPVCSAPDLPELREPERAQGPASVIRSVAQREPRALAQEPESQRLAARFQPERALLLLLVCLFGV